MLFILTMLGVNYASPQGYINVDTLKAVIPFRNFSSLVYLDC